MKVLIRVGLQILEVIIYHLNKLYLQSPINYIDKIAPKNLDQLKKRGTCKSTMRARSLQWPLFTIFGLGRKAHAPIVCLICEI
jgi:hypothetical protein